MLLLIQIILMQYNELSCFESLIIINSEIMVLEVYISLQEKSLNVFIFQSYNN